MSKGSSKTTSNQTQTTTPSAATASALASNLANAQNLVSNSSYQPLSAATINSYESPYLGDVANATMAQLQNQNQQQISQNGVSAAASGDYNSNRAGVQDALTNQLYGQTAATTLANLYNSGYQNAENVGSAQTEAANQYPLALQQLLSQATAVQASGGGSTSTGSGTSNTSSSSLNLGGLLGTSTGGGGTLLGDGLSFFGL